MNMYTNKDLTLNKYSLSLFRSVTTSQNTSVQCQTLDKFSNIPKNVFCQEDKKISERLEGKRKLKTFSLFIAFQHMGRGVSLLGQIPNLNVFFSIF